MLNEVKLKKQNLDENATLDLKERAAYGVGDFANNMMFAPVNSFMTYFLTNVAGINAGIVGTILLISRIFDGFTDLGVGVLMEKFRSKDGKARPWLFTAPDIGMRGKIIYAFITYNLAVTIMYTAINLPFGSLAAMMTRNQYERGVLNISKMIFAFSGGLFINMATLPMVEFFGGGARGWQLTFVVFATIAVVLYLVTYRFTKERVGVTEEGTVKKEEVDIKKALKALLKNKYWVLLLVIFFFSSISNALTGVNVYYCEYILNKPGLIAAFSLYSTIASLATFACLSFFVKKFGKRNTALGGTIISLVACLLLLIAPTNLGMIYFTLLLKGVGNAAVAGTTYGMLADTIEYSEWHSGIRAEGLVFSANSIGSKIGSGIGAAALGWGLAFAGFISSSATQSQGALDGISFMFIVVPIILFAIQIIGLLMYKLDKEYDGIINELNMRKSK